jgi:hypothetical protein
MQFTGAKGITLFIAIVVLACASGFGSGLLVGRKFPAHTFQKFGETKYVFDPITGNVCDPFRDPKESANPFDHLLDPSAKPQTDSKSQPNLFDQGLSPSQGSNLPPGFVLEGTQDKNGFQVVKPASNYPPACGK